LPRSLQLAAETCSDETAIKVTDGSVEVVSEGHWKFFPAPLSGLGANAG
jgi:hypothetical protein